MCREPCRAGTRLCARLLSKIHAPWRESSSRSSDRSFFLHPRHRSRFRIPPLTRALILGSWSMQFPPLSFCCHRSASSGDAQSRRRCEAGQSASGRVAPQMRRASRTRASPHRYVSHREVGRRPHCLDTFNALIAIGLQIRFESRCGRMWTSNGRPEWRAAYFWRMHRRGDGRPSMWAPLPSTKLRGSKLCKLRLALCLSP